MKLRAAPIAICLAFQVACPLLVHADVAVVVSRESPLRELSTAEVSDLYLGRQRRLASGEPAQVFEQPRGSATRESFFRLLNGMTLKQLNAYWARLQFSGQVLPPVALVDDKAMLAAVRSNRFAIGYVDASRVDDSVFVILRLKDN